MFITFEGIDGAGKTTQLNFLAHYLETKNIKVLKLREPGGTELSEKIRQLLLDNNSEMHSITELLLFEAARSHLVTTIIKPALEKGIWVLCDRFFDSTTAYQGYGRQLDLEKVELLNKIAANELSPDLTFYLKLPFNEAQNRSKHRKSDRIESNDSHFFQRIMEGFDKIAQNNPHRFFILNSSDDKETVHQKIIEILNSKMNEVNY